MSCKTTTQFPADVTAPGAAAADAAHRSDVIPRRAHYVCQRERTQGEVGVAFSQRFARKVGRGGGWKCWMDHVAVEAILFGIRGMISGVAGNGVSFKMFLLCGTFLVRVPRKQTAN